MFPDRKPRGYRHVVLAAVVWVIIGNASHPQFDAKPMDEQRVQEVQRDLPRIADALEGIARNQPASPNKDAGCNPGEDNRQSDLCAQWKAADAAYESARWTRATFWLGFVGLFLGLGTLIAAALAALYAKKTADSFVKTEDANLVASFTIDEDGDADIALAVMNVGRSVALINSVEFYDSSALLLTKTLRPGESKVLSHTIRFDLDKAFQTIIKYETVLRKDAKLTIVADIVNDEEGNPWVMVLSSKTTEH